MSLLEHAVIRTFHTSADERDIQAMTRNKGSLLRNLLVIALPVGLFLFALVYAVWRSVIAASVAGVLAFTASAWSNARFFIAVRRRQASRTDNQVVEVIEIEALRVLDIEPLGSHGPAWVFFAADGKALLLAGQWLLRYRAFPSTDFRVYRWADTKKPIRIEPTGRRVKPEHSTVQLRASFRLTDVELFDASPDSLQQDLDRTFDQKVT
jgi:hypothetical protein